MAHIFYGHGALMEFESITREGWYERIDGVHRIRLDTDHDRNNDRVVQMVRS